MEMKKTQSSINTGDKEEQIQTANNPEFKDYFKDTIKSDYSTDRGIGT